MFISGSFALNHVHSSFHCCVLVSKVQPNSSVECEGEHGEGGVEAPDNNGRE